MPQLKIATSTFTLPLEVATETNALLAKKGAGKSNAAIVLVEELHRVGVPWVYIDPKGDSWGVRSSADGTKPGLPVPVFGGRHGDIPLEPTAGALIADLILGDGDYLSCVLDVSQFTYAERDRFLLAFGERLFRQKDEQGVLHLILEEAHEYLPQSVGRTQAQLVGMYQRIVKQGRFKGLGVTLVSQRSAALNKDVLTQADNLFLLRTTSPQDRAAVKAWFEQHADAGEVIKELPSLASGRCWLWSPERFDSPQKFLFRRRQTFDSGATPTVGQAKVVPRTLADVDLGAIKDAMAETIEKAKADDPRELRKQIRELQAEIDRMADAPLVEHVEVPAISDADISRLEGALAGFNITMRELAAKVEQQINGPGVILNRLALERGLGDGLPTQTSIPSRPSAVRVGQHGAETGHRALPNAPRVHEPRRGPRPPAGDGPQIGKTERNILTVLCQHGAVNHNTLALLSGYSPKASTISVAMGKLRREGLVEAGQPYRVTDAGREAMDGAYEELPTGAALLMYWRNRFGLTERNVLDAFIELHPNSATQPEVAELTGYSPQASTISVALGKLRKVGVIEGWHLSDDFARIVGLD